VIDVEITILDVDKIKKTKEGVKKAIETAKVIRKVTQIVNKDDIKDVLWNLRDEIYIEHCLSSSKYLEFAVKCRGTVLGRMVIHDDGRIEGKIEVDKAKVAEIMQGALLHLDFLIFSVLQDLKDCFRPEKIEEDEE